MSNTLIQQVATGEYLANAKSGEVLQFDRSQDAAMYLRTLVRQGVLKSGSCQLVPGRAKGMRK